MLWRYYGLSSAERDGMGRDGTGRNGTGREGTERIEAGEDWGQERASSCTMTFSRSAGISSGSRTQSDGRTRQRNGWMGRVMEMEIGDERTLEGFRGAQLTSVVG